MKCRQAVRHKILILVFAVSNTATSTNMEVYTVSGSGADCKSAV